jgi:hypothetical protein
MAGDLKAKMFVAEVVENWLQLQEVVELQIELP